MENKRITFEEFCDPHRRRALQMTLKSEAIWVTFHELNGLINLSKFAREYFGRSHAWLSQKINGMEVCGRERSFTSDEAADLTSALRDIARRLQIAADEIDAAPTAHT